MREVIDEAKDREHRINSTRNDFDAHLSEQKGFNKFVETSLTELSNNIQKSNDHILSEIDKLEGKSIAASNLTNEAIVLTRDDLEKLIVEVRTKLCDDLRLVKEELVRRDNGRFNAKQVICNTISKHNSSFWTRHFPLFISADKLWKIFSEL